MRARKHCKYASVTFCGQNTLRGVALERLERPQARRNKDVKTSDLNFTWRFNHLQWIRLSLPKVPLVSLQRWCLHHLVGELATLPGRCAGLGPRWFWSPSRSPKMKGIGILRGYLGVTPRGPRIPNHQAPNHQLTIGWHIQFYEWIPTWKYQIHRRKKNPYRTSVFHSPRLMSVSGLEAQQFVVKALSEPRRGHLHAHALSELLMST